MFHSFLTCPAVLVIYTLNLLTLSRTHTVMTTLFVDGVNQGDGVCIRMNNNGNTSNFFVSPVGSADIACGFQGEAGVSRVCPAKSSSVLTFEFRESPDKVTSAPLDPSHKGPASVYLKRVPSAMASNNAAGDGWFKIWESVYDETAQKWGTTKMIENDGHISVQIPQDLQGGYYLARTELLALHAADSTPPNPQFFVGCAQLFIESNGTATPETVSIGAGTYDVNRMPGLRYNIYEKPLKKPYPMVGPPVYTPDLTTTAACVNRSPNRGTNMTQTEGFKPHGCIFMNGNWCGFEVPSYTNQNCCWASSDRCWAQSDDCWNKTQPTGYQLCPIWQKKCGQISNGCKNNEWTGPPKKGADLTPDLPALVGGMKVFT